MVLAILQARVSSSRLPAKILKPILGKPMILHEIDRLKKSMFIDRLVVATSNEASDDAFASLCNESGVDIYRGALDDVLDRYYQCAKQYSSTYVVRVTGDCPVIDWNIVDEVIQLHIQEKNDYTSNTLVPTYPDGLDVEVMNFSVLEQAWKLAKLSSEREHVTLYIYNRSDQFKLGCLTNQQDLSELRWTVDEPADFEFISEVYHALYKKNPYFTMMNIVDLLAIRPDLKLINAGIARNEGLKKSLEADRTWIGRGV